MESRSIKKYIRISRRKVARLASLCSNKRLANVKAQMAILPQDSARQIFKALRSAEANYQVKNPNFNTDNLIVRSINVEVGPSFKRMLPRARGSADTIKKRSAHIRVVLTDGQK
ncbi:MAG: 50S ribosomal protein L22 [Spirochaetes bacterium]|nr:50S ribosomal protein L22 [Spirochaetota bacterium]